MNPTKYAPADRVAHVMRRTGCTERQAIDELIAEEGSTADAVLNVNAAKADDPRLMPRETWQCQARHERRGVRDLRGQR